MRSGLGRLFTKDGDKYEGQWQNDKREGFGVIFVANGDRFEGHFHNDLKEGPGTYFYIKKGQKYEGEWVAGIAKCGSISAIDPEIPLNDFGDNLIAKIDLVDPDLIIEREIMKIREQRERLLN